MNLSRAHELTAQPRTTDITIKENVTFYQMGLSQRILNGLTACGFEKPSPIQLKAVPLGRCGFDLLIQAKSGTGKTAVFGIIALEMINLNNSVHQVLILAPTREIAVQISSVFSSIGSEMPGLKVNYFVGGTPMQSDKSKIKDCHVVVSTPGRLKHLIDQKLVKIDNVRLFVLDEADKLMDDSFLKDVNCIFSQLPANKQVILSSATYPENITIFTQKYMRMPLVCSPDDRSPILLGLRQFVVLVPDHPNRMKRVEIKMAELSKILRHLKFKQSLVFFNYQSRAQSVCNHIVGKGLESTFITGSQDMKKRLNTMESLKNFKCRILCSTDLTARGIDAENVNLVVNFDVPCDSATYFHRIGRAGRYGAYGIAISLVSAGELDDFRGLFSSLAVPSTEMYKLSGDYRREDIWTGSMEQFEVFMRYGRNSFDINGKNGGFEGSNDGNLEKLNNIQNNLCKIVRVSDLSAKIEPISAEDLIALTYKKKKSEVLKKEAKVEPVSSNLRLAELRNSLLSDKSDLCDSHFIGYLDYDVRKKKKTVPLVYEVQKSIDFDDFNSFERFSTSEFDSELINAYRIISNSRFEDKNNDLESKIICKCLQYELEFFGNLEKICINGQKTPRQMLLRDYWSHLKTFLGVANKIYLFMQSNSKRKENCGVINLKNGQFKNSYENLKKKMRLFFFGVLEIEDSIFDFCISEEDVESHNEFIKCSDDCLNISKLLMKKKSVMLATSLEVGKKSNGISKEIMRYSQELEEESSDEEFCQNQGESCAEIDNESTEVWTNAPLIVERTENYNQQMNNSYYNSYIINDVTENIEEFFYQLSIETKKIEIEMYHRLMSQND